MPAVEKTCPVLPLRDIVVFPHMIVPLFVGRDKSVRALDEVSAKDKQIVLLTQKDASLDDPTPQDMYEVGTLGVIVQLLRLPDGTVKALIEGQERVKTNARKCSGCQAEHAVGSQLHDHNRHLHHHIIKLAE